MREGAVNSEEALAVELDDVVNIQLGDVAVCHCLRSEFRYRR